MGVKLRHLLEQLFVGRRSFLQPIKVEQIALRILDRRRRVGRARLLVTGNNNRRLERRQPVQRRDPAARKASRIAIANAFQAKNPSLSKEQSLLAANVSLQIVRGMMTLYGEADPKGKVLIVAEFKKLLTLYLRGVLSEDEASAK